MTDTRYKTFEEFWPYYLQEHSDGFNRRLHQVGTTGALATVAMAVIKRKPALVPLALVAGYGPAWVGHFKMNALMWSGKLEEEMQRLGVTPRS